VAPSSVLKKVTVIVATRPPATHNRIETLLRSGATRGTRGKLLPLKERWQAVFGRLKNQPEMRRSLGIAAGVFVGLLGYRFAMWAHELWADYLDSAAQLEIVLVAAVTAFAYYFLRRLGARYQWDSLSSSPISEISRQVSSRRNHALQSAALGLLIFVLGLTACSESWLAFCLAFSVCAGLIISQAKSRMKLVKQNNKLMSSPILARLMKDPHFSALAQDDIDNLVQIECCARALHAIESLQEPEATAQSFQQTMAESVAATRSSRLRTRSPEDFQFFANAIFSGKKIPRTTKSLELSRELHSQYLEMFRTLTQRESASDSLRDDFKKICDWFGTTPDEAYKNGFTLEQQEQWIRANELYTHFALAKAESIRTLLSKEVAQNTYAKIRATGADQKSAVMAAYCKASTLGVEMNTDICGVFDRLYAAPTKQVLVKEQ